jgi:hypothetical protein
MSTLRCIFLRQYLLYKYSEVETAHGTAGRGKVWEGEGVGRGGETKCGEMSDKKRGTSLGKRALQVHERTKIISTALGEAG